MGKVDRKNRRGKLWRGTTGKRRPRTKGAEPVVVAPPPKPERKKKK